MVTNKVIVAATLMALANRSLAETCFETCFEAYCGPTPKCSYGLTKGICGCCDVCAKGPGEQCGGLSGKCSKGFECQFAGYFIVMGTCVAYPQQGDLNITRDKASDINTNLDKKESVGRPSGTSLKTLVVTHNSTTLSLPSTKGGELFYKDDKSSIRDWIGQKVEAGQDSIVLRGLMPSTHYTVQWSEQTGKSVKVNIETKDGCYKLGATWAVGEEWTLGCQEKCSCRSGRTLECKPRCLFAPGSKNDSLCTEKPTAEDPECCVMYDCISPVIPATLPGTKPGPVVCEDKAPTYICKHYLDQDLCQHYKSMCTATCGFC